MPRNLINQLPRTPNVGHNYFPQKFPSRRLRKTNLLRDERHRPIRSNTHPPQRLTRIAIQPTGNINRKNRHTQPLHHSGNLPKRIARCLRQPRPENRIKNQRRLPIHNRRRIKRHHRQIHRLNNLPIDHSIAPVFGGIGGENDADLKPTIMQMPRRRQTIPPVVTPAAEDQHLSPSFPRKHRFRDIRRPPRSIFHQNNARDAIPLDRNTINAPNLLAGKSNHKAL